MNGLSEFEAVRARWTEGLRLLPKIEPGIVLFLMFAWTKRERRGADFCRKKIIGPVREMARNPPVVVDVIGSCPTMNVLAERRSILALHCKSCGACELSREDP